MVGVSDSKPPPDVVPPTGPTLETLRHLNDMVGRDVTVSEPGELISDVDGAPIGVGLPITKVATLAGAIFTIAELERAGGRPEDFPNLRFVPIEGATP